MNLLFSKLVFQTPKLILLLSMAVWTVGSCLAQHPAAIEQGIQNLCRVSCGSAGMASVGSGVYLRDQIAGDYVLTAAHVVEDHFNGKGSGRVLCEFRNGESIYGVIDGYQAKYDTAVVKLSRKPNLPGVELKTQHLSKSEDVWLVGYAHGDALTVLHGQYLGRSGPAGEMSEMQWRRASGQAISGMSGGPVFDKTGCVVGNLFGAGDGSTTFVGGPYTRNFLRALFPNMSRGDGLFGVAGAIRQRQSDGCRDGFCPPPSVQNGPSQSFAPPQMPSPGASARQTPNRSPSKPGIGGVAGTCDLGPINKRIAALEKKIAELESRKTSEAEINRITSIVVNSVNSNSEVSKQEFSDLVLRVGKVESSQSEVQQSVANLVLSSNKLLDRLEAINERTQPENLASALPGIKVVHNGETKGVVHLGKSLNLDLEPIPAKGK